MPLFFQTLKASARGLAVLAALIFIPARTFAYWQGWMFIGVFSAATTAIGLYLAARDPALLARRMKAGARAEKRPVQKAVMTLAMASSIALVLVSVLDHRSGWSRVPAWVCVLGAVLVAAGLMIDLRVFRENSFGASTIEKMEGQTVIATGPYALVRHPMYAGVLVMAAGVPLALGSYWGLLFVLIDVPILMLRIVDEEKMLRAELDGYTAYARRVRHRLIPGVW